MADMTDRTHDDVCMVERPRLVWVMGTMSLVSCKDFRVTR